MEATHPGITPMNSQCCISGAKHCDSLMHRIRTIQGRTNLNLAEPHFACNNDERQMRSPAVVDFKKRIKHQQEILERCKRKVADQLDQLYSTRKLLKTKKGDCYETGDHTEVNQVKISQLFPDCKSKRKHKRVEASSVKKGRKIIDAVKAKAKQEGDVTTLEQSQAVTCLKLVQKTPNTEGVEEAVKTSMKKKKRRVHIEQPEEANKKEIESEAKPKHSEMISTESNELSKESHLKNIVNSAIARLNKARSSVKKVMKDDDAQNSEPPPNSNDFTTTTDPKLQVTARPKRKKSKRQQRVVEEAQKPLHGILKGSSISCMSNSRKTEQAAVLQEQETVSNSVMKEINSAKTIARAQSARLTRKPQRLLKKQNKSTGCLLTLQKKSLHELGKAPDVKVEEKVDGEAIKVPSAKDVCKKVTKNTNKTLSTLNEQMSSTLQESIGHLNELCLRVRDCLTDIETDELNYQKQKNKQKQMQFDKPPPSECVECDDDKKINEEEPRIYQVEELQCIPNSNQSFKITKEPSVLTTIEQVITAISLGNGEIQMDMPKVVMEAPPAPASTNPQPEREVSPRRKKSNSKKRTRHGKKHSSSLIKLPSMGKIDCTPSRISTSKLPIWQRQLPSIIEEIQQTVKKQATRTQYRDFLKTLKHLVRNDRCVLPQKYIEKGDVQQMPPSSPPRGEKVQAKAPKQVYQRLKDVKNAIEVTGLSEGKKSKPCTQCALDKCMCGVKVVNLCPTESLLARQKLQWIRTRSDMGNNSFQTYDILDEISLKDVEPIQSEYPRKDHLPSSASMKKVEDTLLYQLVYNRNPKLLENFLQSTSFIVDALKLERKSTEKSTSERHVTINKVEQKLRPKSASNAYKLYERFEFDRDVPPPPEKPIASDLTKEIQVVKAPKSKPKSSAKKIDDSYSFQSIKSKSVKSRPEKTAQEKLRLFNKSSSAKSVSKKGKKDLIRAKLRPLLQDPNFKMKKILTIMPTFIDQREQMTKTAKEAIKAKLRPYIADPDKMFMVYPLHVKYQSHQGALESTAKRDVIQKLKPYIFMNLSSTKVDSKIPQNEAGLNLSNPKKIFAVYPVQVRYQYQKNDGKQKTVKISRAVSELELDACHKEAFETVVKKDYEESLQSMMKREEVALQPRAKRGVSLESMAAKKDVVFEASHKRALESMIKREGALESMAKSHKGALESMTKRDVIKKLKPYIFMNLAPTELTVMPVSAKYNAKPQNPAESYYPRAGHRASENTVPKPSTSKKNPWFPKDHGDDCYTGKKLCKKCQMQIGTEQMKCTENFTVMTHMEPNYLPSKLGDRRQYWSSNNRKTTGEHLVSVVVKNTQEVKPTKTKQQPNIKNTKQEAANKEFYRNAANTRNKLKEVKKMVKKNDLISQDLQDIIDTIEFKIVDVLSNQKKDCSGALRNIEDEIKCVLEMVSPKPPLKSSPNSKGKSKLTTPKFDETLPIHDETPVRDSLTTKIDNALLNLEQRQNKNDSRDNKMICIYAKGPSDNSLQIIPKKEPEMSKSELEVIDSEQEDAELRNIDENIEKVISDLDSLINPGSVEVKELTENLEKPDSEDVPTKDVEGFTDSQAQLTIDDDFSAKGNADLKSVDSPKEVPIVKEEFNCENMVTNFCKQVNTVIKNITMSEESLAQKREAENEIVTVQSDHESTVRTDEYLTPYMRAIKDYRRSANQTQSFMDFLNELSRLSQEETAVHYNYKHTMNRASIDNMPEIKEVIERSHIRRLKVENLLAPSSENKAKHAKKKMKNRRLQTAAPFQEYYELETHNKNKDMQTEGEYIEEEDDDCFQPPKYAETIQIQTSEVTNRGTQHESNPFQSQSFTWSLLSEPTSSLNTQSAEAANLLEVPEEVRLIETATDVDLLENTKNKDTQIPNGGNHQCFTSIENQITQVTDDLKRLCTHTIESQVSELHFKSLSHSVSVGTELKPCSLDKTCSNLSTVTSNGSYDQIKDFVCIKSQSKLSESCQQMEETLCKNHSDKKVQADLSSSIIKSPDLEDPKNKEVVSIFECKNSMSSATKVIDYLESKHEEEAMLTTIYNDRVSFGINTSDVLMGDAKLYGCVDNLCPVKNETDLEIADAHKRLLGSVYGIVFMVVFLGLNLQYSC